MTCRVNFFVNFTLELQSRNHYQCTESNFWVDSSLSDSITLKDSCDKSTAVSDLCYHAEVHYSLQECEKRLGDREQECGQLQQELHAIKTELSSVTDTKHRLARQVRLCCQHQIFGIFLFYRISEVVKEPSWRLCIQSKNTCWCLSSPKWAYMSLGRCCICGRFRRWKCNLFIKNLCNRLQLHWMCTVTVVVWLKCMYISGLILDVILGGRPWAEDEIFGTCW